MTTAKWVRFQMALPVVFMLKLFQQIAQRCSDELGPTCILFRFGDSVIELVHASFFQMGLHGINAYSKSALGFVNSVESAVTQSSSPFLLAFILVLFSLGAIGMVLDHTLLVLSRKLLSSHKRR